MSQASSAPRSRPPTPSRDPAPLFVRTSPASSISEDHHPHHSLDGTTGHAAADPESPLQRYTKRQKILLTILAALGGTLSSLASYTYFPMIPDLAADLHVSSTIMSLTVTTYMICQALSPPFWGSLSDAYGRRITYLLTITIFIGSCVGLALSKSYVDLLVLRCVQSIGSASTIALGAGVVGDVTTREERGGYIGYFQTGILLPYVAGPIISGSLSQALGWRATFWFLVCYGTAVMLLIWAFLPETLEAVRGGRQGWTARPIDWLRRKRKQAGAEEVEHEKVRLDLLSPILIAFGGQYTLVVMYYSVYYVVWQMTISSLSTLERRTYRLKQILLGVTFIANGLGCIGGTILAGKLLDRHYRKFQKTHTGLPEAFPLYRARLRTLWFWGILQCASTITLGWALQKDYHIAVTVACVFVTGWSVTAIISAVQTYMVDSFPGRGASATAALNLARGLPGAGGAAAVIPIVDRFGAGYTFTVLGCTTLVPLGSILWRQFRAKDWKEAEAFEKQEVVEGTEAQKALEMPG